MPRKPSRKPSNPRKAAAVAAHLGELDAKKTAKHGRYCHAHNPVSDAELAALTEAGTVVRHSPLATETGPQCSGCGRQRVFDGDDGTKQAQP